MRHQLARLLRCIATHIDPPAGLTDARTRYHQAARHFAEAEHDLIHAVHVQAD